MSERAWAETLGFPPQTVRNYLTGRTRHPSADFLAKVSETYGVTIDWLVTGEEMPLWRQRAEVPRPPHPNGRIHDLVDRALANGGDRARALLEAYLQALDPGAAAEPAPHPAPDSGAAADIYRLVDELLTKGLGPRTVQAALENALDGYETRRAVRHDTDEARRRLASEARAATRPGRAPGEEHPPADEA